MFDKKKKRITKTNRKRVFTAAGLAAALLTGTLAVPDMDAYAWGTDQMPEIGTTEFRNYDASDASTQTIITWNKIDSEEDYQDFLTLTKRDGGVKLLVMFKDTQSGNIRVLGGEDWTRSESYTDCAINRYYHEYDPDDEDYFAHNDSINKMYWITTDGTISGNPVQTIGSSIDGFTTIYQEADQLVTYGNEGSFTAVSDELTEDEDDFDILTNTSDGSTDYLSCREGAPIFWERYHKLEGNGFYMDWILPVLGTSGSQAATIEKTDYESDHHDDYGNLVLSLNVNRAWKLGQWSTENGNGEKRWDIQYIYQDTMDPVENFRNTFDAPGHTMAKWCDDDDDYFQYGYTLLAAQSHDAYEFCTAIEWCSKKEISYYDSPDYLYELDWEQEVLGAVCYNSDDVSAKGGCDSGYNLKSGDYNYRLQCGFTVYYQVDGISLSAMYEDRYKEHNANVEDFAYVAPAEEIEVSGNKISGNSVYTVRKNQCIVIPKGEQITIEKGSTLVVSRNAVLVLNGGLLNYGTILVQPGGMILRYQDANWNAAVYALTGDTETDRERVDWQTGFLVPVSLATNNDGDEWECPYVDVNNAANSCIICAGGNLIVRDNGRIRVNSLAISFDPSASTNTTDLTSYASSEKSTLLNYGFIMAGNITVEDGTTWIVDGGIIARGSDYSCDLATGIESMEYLLETYGEIALASGIGRYYCDPILKNGGRVYGINN